MFESPGVAEFPFTAPPGLGLSLPLIYITWMAVVVAMYPLCRWFESVKRRNPAAWLRYL